MGHHCLDLSKKEDDLIEDRLADAWWKIVDAALNDSAERVMLILDVLDSLVNADCCWLMRTSDVGNDRQF